MIGKLTRTKLRTCLVWGAIGLLTQVFEVTQCHANVGDFLGFGSKTMALGGASVAGDSSPFAAYHNPAGLAGLEAERLKLSWGLVFVRPSFLGIDQIVTQNTYVADAEVVGSADTSYRDTFGQVFGLSYRLLPDFGQLTVGVVSFLPINQLAYMDSGQPYVPEYFLYRARTQRPQFEVGAGMKVLPNLRFGVGLHTAFGLTGNASVFMNTKANTVSTMTFAASMKPLFSSYFGLIWAPGESEEKKESPFQVGVVYRTPVASTITMPMTASAAVLAQNAGMDFVFNAASALYFDPASIETGVSLKAGNHRWIAQADYQLWSAYQPPALSLTQGTSIPGSNHTLFPIAPGTVPSFTYVNIWVPRWGWEWSVSQAHTIRLGYSYRPSVLKDVSNGTGNYLDPPKHVVTAGWGLQFGSFLGYSVPCQLDLAFHFQQLLTQNITKDTGDETGDATKKRIGAPGYQAGGRLFGGSASLAFAF